MTMDFATINLVVPYYEIHLNVLATLADFAWESIGDDYRLVFDYGAQFEKEAKKFDRFPPISWSDLPELIKKLTSEHQEKLKLLLQNAKHPLVKGIYDLLMEGQTSNEDFYVRTSHVVTVSVFFHIIFPDFAQRILPKDPIADLLRSDDIVTFRAHLNNNEFPLHIRNSDGGNLLHGAAANNALEIAKFLIERESFSLEARNQRGMTPLLEAAHMGHLPMVQYLVEMGADPLAKTKDKYDIFALAAFSKNDELLDYIEAHPQWVGEVRTQMMALASSRNEKRLIHGIEQGHYPLLIMDRGKRVFDIVDWAINMHLIEVLRYLYTNKAVEMTHHTSLFDPLQLAVIRNQPEVVELLLSFGLTFKPLPGRVSIANYVLQNFGEEFFFKMIAQGLVFRENEFDIGLYASYHGSKKLLEWFISKGFTVNQKSPERYSILTNVLVKQRKDLLPILLPHCDVNYYNTNKIPVITSAVTAGDLDSTKILLALGYSPNIRFNSSSLTVVQSAIKQNNVELLRVLLEAGASPHGAIGSFTLPYVLAKQAKNPEMVELVKKFKGRTLLTVMLWTFLFEIVGVALLVLLVWLLTA